MNDYLGPNYPYHQNISTPEEMGMSTAGNLGALGKNMAGLINYGSLLMTGDGIANKKIKYEQANLGGMQPIGDRIFIKTPGKCKKRVWDGKKIVATNEEDKDEYERHVYVDHIPTGNIPGLGNISAMKGFVPGILDNIFKLNPTKIISAMGQPAVPDCLEVEFETIKHNSKNTNDKKHDVIIEKKWVAIDDLKDLNPCTFKTVKTDDYPKISGESVSQATGNMFQHPLIEGSVASCSWTETPKEESFANLFEIKNQNSRNPIINVKNKPIAKIFNASFGILLAYLLFKVLKKEIN